MEIRNIHFSHTPRYAILSAEAKNGLTDEILYFAVRRKYERFIFKSATPFLSGVFLPMAKMGQIITVRGDISKYLANDLKKTNLILRRSNLGFRTARIMSDGYCNNVKGKHSGLFFSGDIASTRKFIEKFGTRKKISHLIYIRGFDGRSDEHDIFIRVRRLAQTCKLGLVIVHTNLRDVTDPVSDWHFASLGALSAVGNFLSNGFRQIVVPDVKGSSVLSANWISLVVKNMIREMEKPKTFLRRARNIIRDLDARYNNFRLYRFLLRLNSFRQYSFH